MGITIPIITDFNSRGIDSATRAFNKLETTGQKAGFAVRKAAVPAGIALVALGAAAIDFGKAAIEDAASSDLLAGQLKRVTGATDDGVAAADKYITALSMQVGIADDQLRPALGKLATATGDVSKAQELLGIALDVSAQTSKPLSAVTSSLAKAYGGNLGALKKLIPGFDEGIIKSKDFEKAQAELAKLTGGAAADAAETGAGKFRTLGVTLDETKEAIGAALMPIISAALPLLQKFAEFAQENSTLLVILAAVIGGVAVAIGLANVAMTILALNPVVLTIIAITAGIALLTAGFILAYKKSETFRNIVDGVFAAVKGYVEIVVNYLKGPLMAAWDIVSGAIDAISALIRGDFGAAWDGLKTMIGGVIDWVKSTLLALPLLILGYAKDIGIAIVNGIVSGVATLGETTWNAISGVATYLLNAAAGWFKGLNEIGGKVISFIVSGVTGLGQDIWDKISGFVMFVGDKIVGVKDSIVGFGSKIFEYIGEGMTSAANGLAGIIIGALNKVIGFLNTGLAGVNKGIDLINKVNPFDDVPRIPNIPTIAVPRGATGGIVTRPTLAVIGEAGPEAVIPLNRTPGSSPLGGMGGITINVQAGLVSTPDQIGQQIIEAIQNAQRRSGPVFAAA